MNPDAKRPPPNHGDQKRGSAQESSGSQPRIRDPRLSSQFLTAWACHWGAAQWDALWGSETVGG